MADSTNTVVTSGGTPEWYNDYLKQLSAAAKGLSQEEYQPYQGPRVAEFTPEQQEAFMRTRDSLDMWKPYVQQSLDALASGQGGLNTMASMTQQAGKFDRPTYENTYWDIYKPEVEKMQEEINRLGQQNFQNTTLKQLNDAFTGSGQFGSGRHQILGADAAAQAQADIAGKMATVGMQGKQNAMQDYLNWSKQQGAMGQQMGNYAENQAKMGTDLMNFGLGTQRAAMGDATALYNMGAQQQGQNQQNLNLAYQDFQDQQNFPWQQLNNLSSVIRGYQVPQFQSSVSLPNPNAVTQSNPWTQAGSAAGGAWNILSSFS